MLFRQRNSLQALLGTQINITDNMLFSSHRNHRQVMLYLVHNCQVLPDIACQLNSFLILIIVIIKSSWSKARLISLCLRV